MVNVPDTNLKEKKINPQINYSMFDNKWSFRTNNLSQKLLPLISFHFSVQNFYPKLEFFLFYSTLAVNFVDIFLKALAEGLNVADCD